MTDARPTVLHVLEALEGGTARHVIDVVRSATGTDHEVAVPAERRGGMTDRTAIGRMRDAGATVHLLPLCRTPWTVGNVRSLVGLRRLVRARRPDVVHTHSSIGGLVGRLAVAGTGLPRVYTPNGITSVGIGRLVERRLRPLTDRFIAVSESEGALALELGLIDPAGLLVVPNGIELDDPEPIDLRARFAIPAGAPVVGTIARLVPQKAPLDLLAAWATVAEQHPTAHFVWIGGGELEREFEAALDATPALRARLHRIDELPGAAGALGDLDLFSLASVFEGGPYAPLEAMRAGAAVVLTDVVGSRDAVVDGASGLLVPPGQPAALAAAITGLLDDPLRRTHLAEAGRQRVADHFDVRTMGARLDALYLELTRSPRTGR